MTTHHILPALICLCSLISGCVPLVDATNDGPINPDPGKRSFGSYIDDQNLSTVVNVNIKNADPQLDEAHINVYSFNQVILITGEVATEELRSKASTVASNTHGVRQVHNELKAQPASSFMSRVNDNWLTNKIKAKLVARKDIDSDRVKIIVEDEVVYLMGLLTRAQTEKITDVVRDTGGVKKVVRAIEYID